MMETSGDILNIVLAVAIAVFTGFLCWLLFVVTMSIKRILSVIDEVHKLVIAIKDKVDRAERLFLTVEEKVKNLASLFPIVAAGIAKVVEYIAKRKSSKKQTSSRKDE